MHRRISTFQVIMGFLGGICFVGACPDGGSTGDGSDHASPTSTSTSSGLSMATAHAETAAGEEACETWEVKVLPVPESGVEIPTGWFPFAGNANFGNNVFIRRCIL